jgi:N-acetylglucosaminyl-diphospho-decaprenol L-rhamnosyltransferase
VNKPRVSLVVVNFNAGPAILDCLGSVVGRDDVESEVILVDNGSTDGSRELARNRFPELRLVELGENHGYAAASNRGLALATGEWIGLLNPDTVVPGGALRALVEVLQANSDLGAVGPALVWPDGEPQPYSHGGDPSPLYLARRAIGRLFGRALHEWADGSMRRVDWVSGAALIARRAAIQQVGGLDERFFLYFEDVDLCRRLRQSGWQIAFVPSVAIVHRSRPDSADAGRRRHAEQSLRYFYRKNYGLLAGLSIRAILWLRSAFDRRCRSK